MRIDPEDGYLRSGGYSLHYLVWGKRGPKLVLLHSMGMDAHAFDLFSEALQGEFRLLAFDLLDHGDSEKPEDVVDIHKHSEIIRNAYRQVGFHPNVLVGHSIGGMIGMFLAAEHPEEFKGLVLVDIAPISPSKRPSRPPAPESFAGEEEARRYLRQRYPSFHPQALENRMKYAFVRDEEGRLRFKATGDTIRRSLNIDLWPYVDRIKTPTLLILGSKSDVVTDEALERMKETLSDLEVVTIEGSTHMVPQDKPKEFEGSVRAFLKKLD